MMPCLSFCYTLNARKQLWLQLIDDMVEVVSTCTRTWPD